MKKISTLMFLILFLTQMLFAENKDKIYIMDSEPLLIFADLKGEHKNKKILIKQKKNENNNSYEIIYTIYDDNKVEFEYKWNHYLPIWFIKVVRFPGSPNIKEKYRDLLFIITGGGDLFLNILIWESQITESDIQKSIKSKDNLKNKGKYRFIKTDIQINAPYG